MGWQEEELVKKAAEAIKEAARRNQESVAAREADALWTKIVEANKRLAPGIRCNEDGRTLIAEGCDKFTGRTISIDSSDKFFFYTAEQIAFTPAHAIVLGRGGYVFAFIYFDASKNKYRVYEGSRTHLNAEDVETQDVLGVDGKYYKFDETDIDVLLRNICTGRSLTDGLRKESFLSRMW